MSEKESVLSERDKVCVRERERERDVAYYVKERGCVRMRKRESVYLVKERGCVCE